MRRRLVLVGALLAVALWPQGPANAQATGIIQSDVLVIEPERLLLESQYGQRLQDELQAERDRLIAHNERVASQLEAEEQALTGLRNSTPPDEFRALADAFDKKVEELRLESERMSRELERRRERVPVQFMRVVRPVLVELLREANAMVMLDARALLLHAEDADVTALAIKRIDAQIGAGPPKPDAEDPPANPAPDD